VVFELDSVTAVAKLNGEGPDRSIHAHLVEDSGSKVELRGLEDHGIRWARRSANRVAHNLAREGCGLEISKT
jgi:hypothetical protein